MEVTYHGLSCVRLRGRDATVLIDPPQTSLPGLARNAPDIVVRTEGPTDPERLRAREGHAQEVSGPGEFEVRGVGVFGVPAGDTTVMRVEIDDVRLVAAGRLRRQLTEDEIDALGHVDVLVVPVGGGDALSATEASKLVSAVEPSIVVPARFRSTGGAVEYEPVDKFAKEMGLAEGTWQMVPKLNLSGPSAEDSDTRVVILEPRT
ncbi:MAG: MBL fold metallo-hydrolase [Candidatus Dormibacteraeota bacterium]|nr:MBL fold metallo-hydrolase [Candidatus Dormibacteraeota bacterium]MBV9524201.1 MBL fold metallo-hydrolase [Candidatus Dormibacteraeota bacterium]